MSVLQTANSTDDTEFPLPFSPAWVYVQEDCIWTMLRRFNGLFKMDRNNWALEYMGSFPNEDDCTSIGYMPFYFRPALVNGTFYFPPFHANEAAGYSVKEKTFEKIGFEKNGNDFCQAVAYGDYVFFVPRRCPAIARLNIRTRQITYITDWISPVRKMIGNTSNAYCFFPAVAGDKILFSIIGTNAIAELDMAACETAVHSVGKSLYKFDAICFDGENYWLSSLHGLFLSKWSPETGEIKDLSFEGVSGDDDGHETAFLQCVYCGGYVWLLPHLAKRAYKFNVLTETISIADEFEIDSSVQSVQEQQLCVKYSFVQVFGESIFAYNEITKTLIEYNCKTTERTEKSISFAASTLTQIEPLAEKAICSVRIYDFLNHLSTFSDNEKELLNLKTATDEARSRIVNCNGTAGAAIYKHVKRLIFEN